MEPYGVERLLLLDGRERPPKEYSERLERDLPLLLARPPQLLEVGRPRTEPYLEPAKRHAGLLMGEQGVCRL